MRPPEDPAEERHKGILDDAKLKDGLSSGSRPARTFLVETSRTVDMFKNHKFVWSTGPRARTPGSSGASTSANSRRNCFNGTGNRDFQSVEGTAATTSDPKPRPPGPI
jgi:hypothetical protein